MAKLRPMTTLVAALLIALTSPGCSEAFGSHYKEAVHTRVSQAPAVLSVHNPVGRVTLQSWNQRYVQIDAVKFGPSQDAVHAITLSVQPNGNQLVITADIGENSTGRGVDFTIHAPASTSVTINASVGEVSVAGFTGSVDVESSVGKVSVTMAQLRKGQRINLRNSVGAIDLSIPHDADATIAASTSVGSVKGNVGFSIQRSTVGADGNVVVGSGGAQVQLTASTGSINVDRE